MKQHAGLTYQQAVEILSANTERMMLFHQHRYLYTLSAKSATIREFFIQIPYLLHFNQPSMKFYTPHAPQGVSNFLTLPNQVARFADYVEIDAKNLVEPDYNDIIGIYVMGSATSVTFTPDSDIDMWIVVRNSLTSNQRQALYQKLEKIRLWLLDEQQVEASFYIVDEEHLLYNRHTNQAISEGGIREKVFLLDEFYRSATKLAGKWILWYFLPELPSYSYEEVKQAYLDFGLIKQTDWIDFGGVEIKHLSRKAFYATSLWLIYKGLQNPFKSFIKICLLESYFSEYPHTELVCVRMKKHILQQSTTDTNFSVADGYLGQDLSLKDLTHAANLSYQRNAQISQDPDLATIPIYNPLFAISQLLTTLYPLTGVKTPSTQRAVDFNFTPSTADLIAKQFVNFDSYELVLDKVLTYLQEIGDQERINLVVTSLILKVHKLFSPTLERLRSKFKGNEKRAIAYLLAHLDQQDPQIKVPVGLQSFLKRLEIRYQLNPVTLNIALRFKSWHIGELVKYTENYRQALVKTYLALYQFLLQIPDSGDNLQINFIDEQELKVIEQAVTSLFLQHRNQITVYNRYPDLDLSENYLYFGYLENVGESGEIIWYVVNVDRNNPSANIEHKHIEMRYDLISLICWCYFNGLINAKTKLQLKANPYFNQEMLLNLLKGLRKRGNLARYIQKISRAVSDYIFTGPNLDSDRQTLDYLNAGDAFNLQQQALNAKGNKDNSSRAKINALLREKIAPLTSAVKQLVSQTTSIAANQDLIQQDNDSIASNSNKLLSNALENTKIRAQQSAVPNTVVNATTNSVSPTSWQTKADNKGSTFTAPELGAASQSKDKNLHQSAQKRKTQHNKALLLKRRSTHGFNLVLEIQQMFSDSLPAFLQFGSQEFGINVQFKKSEDGKLPLPLEQEKLKNVYPPTTKTNNVLETNNLENNTLENNKLNNNPQDNNHLNNHLALYLQATQSIDAQVLLNKDSGTNITPQAVTLTRSSSSSEGVSITLNSQQQTIKSSQAQVAAANTTDIQNITYLAVPSEYTLVVTDSLNTHSYALETDEVSVFPTFTSSTNISNSTSLNVNTDPNTNTSLALNLSLEQTKEDQTKVLNKSNEKVLNKNTELEELKEQTATKNLSLSTTLGVNANSSEEIPFTPETSFYSYNAATLTPGDSTSKYALLTKEQEEFQHDQVNLALTPTATASIVTKATTAQNPFTLPSNEYIAASELAFDLQSANVLTPVNLEEEESELTTVALGMPLEISTPLFNNQVYGASLTSQDVLQSPQALLSQATPSQNVAVNGLLSTYQEFLAQADYHANWPTEFNSWERQRQTLGAALNQLLTGNFDVYQARSSLNLLTPVVLEKDHKLVFSYPPYSQDSTITKTLPNKTKDNHDLVTTGFMNYQMFGGNLEHLSVTTRYLQRNNKQGKAISISRLNGLVKVKANNFHADLSHLKHLRVYTLNEQEFTPEKLQPLTPLTLKDQLPFLTVKAVTKVINSTTASQNSNTTNQNCNTVNNSLFTSDLPAMPLTWQKVALATLTSSSKVQQAAKIPYSFKIMLQLASFIYSFNSYRYPNYVTQPLEQVGASLSTKAILYAHNLVAYHLEPSAFLPKALQLTVSISVISYIQLLTTPNWKLTITQDAAQAVANQALRTFSKEIKYLAVAPELSWYAYASYRQLQAIKKYRQHSLNQEFKPGEFLPHHKFSLLDLIAVNKATPQSNTITVAASNALETLSDSISSCDLQGQGHKTFSQQSSALTNFVELAKDKAKESVSFLEQQLEQMLQSSQVMPPAGSWFKVQRYLLQQKHHNSPQQTIPYRLETLAQDSQRTDAAAVSAYPAPQDVTSINVNLDSNPINTVRDTQQVATNSTANDLRTTTTPTGASDFRYQRNKFYLYYMRSCNYFGGSAETTSAPNLAQEKNLLQDSSQETTVGNKATFTAADHLQQAAFANNGASVTIAQEHDEEQHDDTSFSIGGYAVNYAEYYQHKAAMQDIDPQVLEANDRNYFVFDASANTAKNAFTLEQNAKLKQAQENAFASNLEKVNIEVKSPRDKNTKVTSSIFNSSEHTAAQLTNSSQIPSRQAYSEKKNSLHTKVEQSNQEQVRLEQSNCKQREQSQIALEEKVTPLYRSEITSQEFAQQETTDAALASAAFLSSEQGNANSSTAASHFVESPVLSTTLNTSKTPKTIFQAVAPDDRAHCLPVMGEMHWYNYDPALLYLVLSNFRNFIQTNYDYMNILGNLMLAKVKKVVVGKDQVRIYHQNMRYLTEDHILIQPSTIPTYNLQAAIDIDLLQQLATQNAELASLLPPFAGAGLGVMSVIIFVDAQSEIQSKLEQNYSSFKQLLPLSLTESGIHLDLNSYQQSNLQTAAPTLSTSMQMYFQVLTVPQSNKLQKPVVIDDNYQLEFYQRQALTSISPYQFGIKPPVQAKRETDKAPTVSTSLVAIQAEDDYTLDLSHTLHALTGEQADSSAIISKGHKAHSRKSNKPLTYVAPYPTANELLAQTEQGKQQAATPHPSVQAVEISAQNIATSTLVSPRATITKLSRQDENFPLIEVYPFMQQQQLLGIMHQVNINPSIGYKSLISLPSTLGTYLGEDCVDLPMVQHYEQAALRATTPQGSLARYQRIAIVNQLISYMRQPSKKKARLTKAVRKMPTSWLELRKQYQGVTGTSAHSHPHLALTAKSNKHSATFFTDVVTTAQGKLTIIQEHNLGAVANLTASLRTAPTTAAAVTLITTNSTAYVSNTLKSVSSSINSASSYPNPKNSSINSIGSSTNSTSYTNNTHLSNLATATLAPEGDQVQVATNKSNLHNLNQVGISSSNCQASNELTPPIAPFAFTNTANVNNANANQVPTSLAFLPWNKTNLSSALDNQDLNSSPDLLTSFQELNEIFNQEQGVEETEQIANAYIFVKYRDKVTSSMIQQSKTALDLLTYNFTALSYNFIEYLSLVYVTNVGTYRNLRFTGFKALANLAKFLQLHTNSLRDLPNLSVNKLNGPNVSYLNNLILKTILYQLQVNAAPDQDLLQENQLQRRRSAFITKHQVKHTYNLGNYKTTMTDAELPLQIRQSLQFFATQANYGAYQIFVQEVDPQAVDTVYNLYVRSPDNQITLYQNAVGYLPLMLPDCLWTVTSPLAPQILKLQTYLLQENDQQFHATLIPEWSRTFA